MKKILMLVVALMAFAPVAVEAQSIEEYRENVLIENVRMVPASENFMCPCIGGMVRNTGDRALRYVQIIIYYLNREGTAIGESTHTVLRYNDGTYFSVYANSLNPLRPNYVEDFTARLDGPSVWGEPFSFNIELGEIEFVEEDGIDN